MYCAPLISSSRAAHFVRAGADFVNDRRERNAVSAKLVGVEIDLVLPNEPADGRDFGHAGNGFELVAQIPVLKAAQVRQAVLMAVIHEGVFVNPSRAGRVRADDRDARLPAVCPVICCMYSRTRERAQ